MVRGIHLHQYPLMDRLYFLNPKVSELVTGLQIDYNLKHRGNDHVRDSTVNVPIIQTIETDQ